MNGFAGKQGHTGAGSSLCSDGMKKLNFKVHIELI
jgi:hypothetical protein